MQYDPIKREAGNIFNCCRVARVIFYKLLDLILLRSWYVRREMRKWSGFMPAGGRVLDAGSGFGQYVYYVSGLKGGHSVKGIDVKKDEIDLCNRFFGSSRAGSRMEFEKADLNSFSEPGRYDLALCIDVLEHIEDDVKVMKNLCSSLKPSGMLIVSTPSDMGGSDVHAEGESSFIGEHVRDGYSIAEITGKLKSAGFRRVEAEYTYGRPGQVSWKISMKYPVKMLNSGKIFFLVLPLYYLVTFPFALILNYIDLRSKHSSGTGLIVKAYKE